MNRWILLCLFISTTKASFRCPSSHLASAKLIDINAEETVDSYIDGQVSLEDLFDTSRNENDAQCSSAPSFTKNHSNACVIMITFDTPVYSISGADDDGYVENTAGNNINYKYPAFHYGNMDNHTCKYSAAINGVATDVGFEQGCFAYQNHNATVDISSPNKIYTGNEAFSSDVITVVCCCETEMCTEKLNCANISKLAKAVIESKTMGIAYEDWDNYECDMCKDKWGKTTRLLIMILVPIGVVFVGLVSYCIGKRAVDSNGYVQAKIEL